MKLRQSIQNVNKIHFISPLVDATWIELLSMVALIVGYIIHASQFGDWIMDDAGISFAYSRNLANGYGLVSQPGRMPVEGYSNPLWVFIFVPFFWFKLFDPILTPKIVSTIFVSFTFVLFYFGARDILNSKAIAFLTSTLIAASTSFVIWTISGLENSLYVFLAVAMFYVLVAYKNRERFPIVLGVLAGLASLTRPDGVIYVLLFPLFLMFGFLSAEKRKLRDIRILAIDLMKFILPFIILFGSYEIFRIIYFGDFFPNTYYAKGGGIINADILEMMITLHPDYFDEIVELWQVLLGRLALVGFLIMLVSVTHFLTSRRFTVRQWSGLLLFLPAALIYTLLPKDWMGEYRFATIAIPFYYLLLVQFGVTWFSYIRKITVRNTIIWILLFSFLIANISRHTTRTLRFANKPPTPFLTVVSMYVGKFERYSELLGVENPSLLAPDMGGTLYYSELIMYDLGALTDYTIARTIRINQTAFYNYVFDEIQPTFIVTFNGWASVSNFDADPRFRRDYVPIEESIDKNLLLHNLEMYSGTYVRQDVITDPKLLEELRELGS